MHVVDIYKSIYIYTYTYLTCIYICIHVPPLIRHTAGQVISGFGAGLNELIALSGTSELVPIRKRSAYVGGVVFTILPFCPSPLWAQLIARASNWRYVGILVGVWNFIGLILVVFLYKDPAARYGQKRPAKDVLKEVDYIGGLLSIFGITTFMMGLQWGASQVGLAPHGRRDDAC